MNEEKELLNQKKISNLSKSKSNFDKEIDNNLNYKNKIPIYFRLKINLVIILILHALFKILDKLNYIWEIEDVCQNNDPMWKFHERVHFDPYYLCKNKNSTHFCYKNTLNGYQINNGVVCVMRNFILDPSKWQKDNSKYTEQNDYKYNNFPLISNGFFNIECEEENKNSDFNKIYDYYFNSWNYSLINNDIINTEEKYEELAPEKIIFFINRNYDSKNIFNFFLAFLNTFSLMKTYVLNPEDIRVVFLESVDIKDPLYILYEELISRGGSPINIGNLSKKYQISSAINIPIYLDSPNYIFPEILKCKKKTKTFELLDQSIRKYMKIGKITYAPNYDKNIIYYPKNLNSNFTIYKKFVTIQWNKEIPKDKNEKKRILGNGPELVEALSEQLPKNILVRLVDFSLLNIKYQISFMKKTDFFITDSPEGLFFSIFLPPDAIVQEISIENNNNNIFHLMSSLSGHPTYSNIIKANVKMKENSEVLFYDVKYFVKIVLAHLKKINFNN